MRRALLTIVCALFVFSASISAMATDIPYYPDDYSNDGCGPYTDPDTSDSDTSSPDSTDSGDSWDGSNSDGGFDGGGYGGDVLF